MYYGLIKKLLTFKEKKRFYWIFFSMLIFSFFESLGLSLIIPYVGILNHNEATTHWIQNHLDISLTEMELIIWMSVLFFGLITIKFLLQIYVSKECSKFPYEFYKEKSQRNYRFYLQQPYLDYIHGTAGFYVRNCTHTIDQCASGLVFYLRYLSCLVTTLFLFGLILIQNFYVSATFIALFSALGYAIHKISKKPQLRSGKEREENVAKLYQWINDSFVVFKEVKLYQKENRFFSIFYQYNEKLSRASEQSIFYPTLPPVFIEYFAVIVLLSVVGIYVMNGYPISGIIAPLLFYGAVGRRLLPCLTQTVSHRIQMQHYVAALEGLNVELQKSSIAKQTVKKAVNFDRFLQFSHVHFSYNSNEEILKDVDFIFEKNKSIAIVGPSGAGKSTIVKLLIGLFKPTQGKMFIDENECFGLDAMSHLIGYVPQDIALMAGTILDNITLFDEKIDEQQLQSAIIMARLEEFITALPEGLNTYIGERGINLSGGQKQRLGIARALYQKPEILLFDEATSSLDNISEALITETIKSMAGQKTIIAIAHRLTTIQNFDLIYVLDEGRVIAKGTHEQLLQSCALYQTLTRSPAAFSQG